jgi:phosphatidylserine decarboxylase
MAVNESDQNRIAVPVDRRVTLRDVVRRLLQVEALNFVVTNRVPRALLTHFIGWFSKIRHPWVRDASIFGWRWFSDVDLSDAAKTRFESLHDCFIRELAQGARQIDTAPDILASPCDAIVGACGRLQDMQALQAKGHAYPIQELLGDPLLAETHRHGCYATLRLTSGMYHRLHAPHDCRVERVTYIAGDVWNVNPPALARIERLFCKNERAVIRIRLQRGGHGVTLVLVAAILVASIRLSFIDVRLHLKYRGANELPCSADLLKGEEMGWFEHGSTVIVLAPEGFELCEGIRPGQKIQMGCALMQLPALAHPV